MAHYDEPLYITPKDAAIRLGMTEGELNQFTLETGLPKFITQPDRTLYDAADVARVAQEIRS